MSTNVHSDSNQEETAVLRAFGGSVLVPNYIDIIVQKSSEGSFEIRMIKRLGQEGDLLSITIERPAKSEHISTENIELVNKYRVNGFNVELFRSAKPKLGFDLLAARVERCDEVGQIIVRKQEHLDTYLEAATIAGC